MSLARPGTSRTPCVVRLGPPHSAPLACTTENWACLVADPAVVQQALKMLQNPMVMQQMKVMMQDPSVKQRMQKMLSKLGADSGIDPSLADPAMLDKLFERMQAPPAAATQAPRSTPACVRLPAQLLLSRPLPPPPRLSAAPAPRAPPTAPPRAAPQAALQSARSHAMPRAMH